MLEILIITCFILDLFIFLIFFIYQKISISIFFLLNDKLIVGALISVLIILDSLRLQCLLSSYITTLLTFSSTLTHICLLVWIILRCIRNVFLYFHLCCTWSWSLLNIYLPNIILRFMNSFWLFIVIIIFIIVIKSDLSFHVGFRSPNNHFIREYLDSILILDLTINSIIKSFNIIPNQIRCY